MRKYFGTDGVRGTVNREPMTAEFALRLGRAAGYVLTRHLSHSPHILIGKDTRLSGYMLESALCAGLTAQGMHVLLVGPVPTPAVAYLTRSLRADARVVLAALEASGLSVQVFAERESLDPQRLYYWRKRLGSDKALTVSPTFVEVPRHAPEPVEIALRSGRSLRVRESIDAATLRRFVTALEEDAAC